MPCLEAEVSVTQSTFHLGLIVLSKRSANDVTTRLGDVNIPALSLVRVDVLILVEARILDEVGHVVAIVVSSVLQSFVQSFAHSSNVGYFLLQLLVGPVVGIDNILIVATVSIRIVCKLVNLGEVSILVVQHILVECSCAVFLPLLPKCDILVDSIVSLVKGS